MPISVRRLGPGDESAARAVFAAMAAGFEEAGRPLSDAYLARLLAREDLWIVGAFDGVITLGGITAHLLPMTNREATEVFIFDIAISPEQQGRGAGTALVAHVRDLAADAGAESLFVPADNEDLHALAFYEAIGGAPTPVTIYTFDPSTR